MNVSIPAGRDGGARVGELLHELRNGSDGSGDNEDPGMDCSEDAHTLQATMAALGTPPQCVASGHPDVTNPRAQNQGLGPAKAAHQEKARVSECQALPTHRVRMFVSSETPIETNIIVTEVDTRERATCLQQWRGQIQTTLPADELTDTDLALAEILTQGLVAQQPL